MLLKRYLIIGKKKQQYSYPKPTARLTVSSPKLESHEIAIALNLDIPDELFSKPQLQASICIPEDSVCSPVIEAEVIDNLQEIVSRELGIDLSISVLDNEDPK